MHRNIPAFKAIITLSFLFILYSSCTKIDSTKLGGELIPAVDNVNTFDTVFKVEGTQGIFDDTTRLVYSHYHILGDITEDPVFGNTKGTVYLELKPPSFPYRFGNYKDTIDPLLAPGTGFDSAVLCLSVKGFWGDSTKSQRFTVHELSRFTTNFRPANGDDTAHFINFQPNSPIGPEIGSVTLVPQDLKNKLYLNTSAKDSVTYQIRIKLTEDFLRNKLLVRWDDSASESSIYHSDSVFKSIMRGFAIVPESFPGSNGIFYTSLDDGATRLEVHYRRKNLNKIDTAFSSFIFSTGLYSSTSFSTHANNITRDRSLGNIEFPNNTQPDILYLQGVPGTYAMLKVPGLSTFENNMVHRAEIIIEQVPGDPAYDALFPPPPYLYIDLKDTGTSGRFKTVYFDLNGSNYYDPDNSGIPYPSQGVSNYYFGGDRRVKKDAFGNNIYYYVINVSRYVQNMITKKGVNYDMRLYAPYLLHYYSSAYFYPNADYLLGNGRVRIGNGDNPNYKLRMRVIYSKL
ncbi:MAG: hypothetical protein QM791_00975 [Ferruginibacter sp.]